MNYINFIDKDKASHDPTPAHFSSFVHLQPFLVQISTVLCISAGLAFFWFFEHKFFLLLCLLFLLPLYVCVCVWGGGKFLQSLPLSFLAWLRFLKAFISSLLHIDQCPVLLVLMVPVNFFPQHLLQFHYIFSYVII